MECCCYLRNVQDKIADGETACEHGICVHFEGPLIPCGAALSCKPLSTNSESRSHQFGKTILVGKFIRSVLHAGDDSWMGCS